MHDIVKVNAYLTNIAPPHADYGQILEEFYGPKTPAHKRVALVAPDPAWFLTETEAIAVL